MIERERTWPSNMASRQLVDPELGVQYERYPAPPVSASNSGAALGSNQPTIAVTPTSDPAEKQGNWTAVYAGLAILTLLVICILGLAAVRIIRTLSPTFVILSLIQNYLRTSKSILSQHPGQRKSTASSILK